MADDIADDLSDEGVFDDAPEVEAKAPAPEAEKVEAEAPKTEAPAKTEAKKEPDEETTSSEPKSVPRQALLDERRKRQQAEDRLRELEGGVKVDPSTEAFNLTIKLSRDLILENHTDYPEMEKVFMELVSEPDADGQGIRITDPTLYQKFRSSPNPAKFAYNHAKQHKAFLERSAPDYEQKLREKIEREVLEKLSKRAPEVEKLPNLTNLAATANNTDKVAETAPTDDEGVWD
jgi:hypothetical protein